MCWLAHFRDKTGMEAEAGILGRCPAGLTSLQLVMCCSLGGNCQRSNLNSVYFELLLWFDWLATSGAALQLRQGISCLLGPHWFEKSYEDVREKLSSS